MKQKVLVFLLLLVLLLTGLSSKNGYDVTCSITNNALGIPCKLTSVQRQELFRMANNTNYNIWRRSSKAIKIMKFLSDKSGRITFEQIKKLWRMILSPDILHITDLHIDDYNKISGIAMFKDEQIVKINDIKSFYYKPQAPISFHSLLKGDYPEAVNILSKSKSFVHKKELGSGNYQILYAVMEGRLDVVRQMIEAGSKVTFTWTPDGKNKQSLLDLAVIHSCENPNSKERHEIVELLLKKDAGCIREPLLLAVDYSDFTNIMSFFKYKKNVVTKTIQKRFKVNKRCSLQDYLSYVDKMIGNRKINKKKKKMLKLIVETKIYLELGEDLQDIKKKTNELKKKCKKMTEYTYIYRYLQFELVKLFLKKKKEQLIKNVFFNMFSRKYKKILKNTILLNLSNKDISNIILNTYNFWKENNFKLNRDGIMSLFDKVKEKKKLLEEKNRKSIGVLQEEFEDIKNIEDENEKLNKLREFLEYTKLHQELRKEVLLLIKKIEEDRDDIINAINSSEIEKVKGIVDETTMHLMNGSRSLFYYAIINGNEQIKEHFLSKKVNVNQRNEKTGLNILLCVVNDIIRYDAKIKKEKYKYLKNVSKKRLYDIVKELLSKELKVDVNNKDRKGTTALTAACQYAHKKKNFKLLEILLKADGIDVNQSIEYKEWSPINIAIAYDKPELLKKIIKLGGDVNRVAKDNLTVVMHAVQLYREECLNIVLSEKPEIIFDPKWEEVLLKLNDKKNTKKILQRLFTYVLKNKKSNFLAGLLVKNLQDTHKKTLINTMFAARLQQETCEVLQYLFDKKILTVNEAIDRDKNLLRLAIMKRKYKMIDFLLENNAKLYDIFDYINLPMYRGKITADQKLDSIYKDYKLSEKYRRRLEVIFYIEYYECIIKQSPAFFVQPPPLYEGQVLEKLMLLTDKFPLDEFVQTAENSWMFLKLYTYLYRYKRFDIIKYLFSINGLNAQDLLYHAFSFDDIKFAKFLIDNKYANINRNMMKVHKGKSILFRFWLLATKIVNKKTVTDLHGEESLKDIEEFNAETDRHKKIMINVLKGGANVDLLINNFGFFFTDDCKAILDIILKHAHGGKLKITRNVFLNSIKALDPNVQGMLIDYKLKNEDLVEIKWEEIVKMLFDRKKEEMLNSLFKKAIMQENYKVLDCFLKQKKSYFCVNIKKIVVDQKETKKQKQQCYKVLSKYYIEKNDPIILKIYLLTAIKLKQKKAVFYAIKEGVKVTGLYIEPKNKTIENTERNFNTFLKDNRIDSNAYTDELRLIFLLGCLSRYKLDPRFAKKYKYDYIIEKLLETINKIEEKNYHILRHERLIFYSLKYKREKLASKIMEEEQLDVLELMRKKLNKNKEFFELLRINYAARNKILEKTTRFKKNVHIDTIISSYGDKFVIPIDDKGLLGEIDFKPYSKKKKEAYNNNIIKEILNALKRLKKRIIVKNSNFVLTMIYDVQTIFLQMYPELPHDNQILNDVQSIVLSV